MMAREEQQQQQQPQMMLMRTGRKRAVRRGQVQPWADRRGSRWGQQALRLAVTSAAVAAAVAVAAVLSAAGGSR
jgi:hypothetical protein